MKALPQDKIKFIRLFYVKILPLFLLLTFATSLYVMVNEPKDSLIGFISVSFSVICFTLVWIINILTKHILSKK